MESVEKPKGEISPLSAAGDAKLASTAVSHPFSSISTAETTKANHNFQVQVVSKKTGHCTRTNVVLGPIWRRVSSGTTGTENARTAARTSASWNSSPGVVFAQLPAMNWVGATVSCPSRRN